MSSEQRPNNTGGNQTPTSHSNNNNNHLANNSSNNSNANSNNNNSNMNPGSAIPVGMHPMQQSMAAMQAGAMQAGMAGAMQPGMAASLQANMSNGIRSPVSQVQLIHSPMPGSPYHLPQFPYNQQIMLQNAAVQAAMQAQMNQQFNLAMQGRPPSVSPKSPSLPVLSPSPSSSQAPMSGSVSSSPSTSMSSAGSGGGKLHNSKAGSNHGNSNQAQVAAMMAGKATMIPRPATAQPIVIGQIGVVGGQPVSSAGFLPQGCDPSQLMNSQAQLRLTNQQQLVTSAGQIFTSQPMFANQAVLQAMASLQQQGIPIGAQPILGAQTPSLIPGQPLFIRPAGPMQPQQNMMTSSSGNSQNVNFKNAKTSEAPTNLQTKPPSTTAGKSTASQGRNLTILPSTSRPGLTARVYPTSVPPQGQATKLNIPQVTPKLSKTKSRSHSAKSQSSTSNQSKTTTTVSVSATKSTSSTTTTTQSSTTATVSPSKNNNSESESDASKKASPSTPPANPVPVRADPPKAKPPTLTTPSPVKAPIESNVEEDMSTETPLLSNPEQQKEETMEVDKAPEPKKDVVVEKQRAIVKPHILTHVIEGFIIQEGPEPFPVQRSSLLTDLNPSKQNNNNNVDAKDSEDDQSPYAFRDPTPDEILEQNLQVDGPSNPTLLSSSTLKCEFCGKVDKAEMFRCSKRFCSTTCTKRYNVGCSRRLGLFRSNSTKEGLNSPKHLVRSASMPAGRRLRKRRPSGLRMRHNWRAGRGGHMTLGNLNSPIADDNSSSRSEHESTSSVGSPSPPLDLDMETDAPQSAPNKWTVQEVYDFIKSITGCSMHADEFRSQEIDGQALMLLKEDHLMSTMNMKLGPALKICARINSLKDDYV